MRRGPPFAAPAPRTPVEDVLVCPICQSPRRSAFATVEDAGREVEYLVCNRCGHVYQSPRMTRDELLAFYTRTYRELRQGTDEPVPKDLLIQAARARHTVRQISGWIPAVSRH